MFGIGSVSLFNGISIFMGYFNAKPFLVKKKKKKKKNSSGTIGARDKGVSTFPKGNSPKVNIIGWLDFELTYYDITV